MKRLIAIFLMFCLFSSSAYAFGGLTNATGLTATNNVDINTILNQPNYYVKTSPYNAKCDGRLLTNITTTATSATITSSSLTADDAGKLISIYAGSKASPTATVTNGSSTLTSVSSLSGIALGQSIVGTGIPAGAKVVDFASTNQVKMSMDATSTPGAGTVNFYNVINTTVSTAGAGTATLATTMTNSISGVARATLGTDDATALQSADTSASAAGGGLLRLPTGMCITSASLIFDSNVSMQGEGWGGSIIKWISTSDQSAPVISNRATVNGISAATCTKAYAETNQHDNQFRDFQVDAESATAASYVVGNKGLTGYCNARSVVDHVYVHDTLATGIAFDSGYPNHVDNSIVVNAGRFGGGQGTNNNAGSNGIGQGTSPTGGDSYFASGNYIVNPAHYGIFVEDQDSLNDLARAVFNNNIIVQGANGGVSGTGSSAAGIGNSGIDNFEAVGNIIYGNNSTASWVGISVDTGTYESIGAGINANITGNFLFGVPILINYSVGNPSSSKVSNTIINSNRIYNSTSTGIQIQPNASGNNMDGFNVTGNYITGSGSCGLAFLAANANSVVKNALVSSNIFINNGATTGTDYRKSGMCVNNVNITNLRMYDNVMYDTASTQKYAVGVNTGSAITGAHITNNDFSGNTTKAWDVLGTIAGIVQDNKADTFTMSGCSATTATGLDLLGKYTSGTTGSCAVVITPNGTANITAPTGYACFAADLTTPADIITQTASSTSTATLTGVTATSDVVNFSCRPF